MAAVARNPRRAEDLSAANKQGACSRNQTRWPLAGTRQSVARSIRVLVREPGCQRGTGSLRAHRATRHGALVTGAQTSRAQTMLPLRRPYNGLEGVLHLHINAYLYWNKPWPIIRCQIWRRAGARTPADSPERKAEHVASAPLFSGAGPKNLVPARRHFSV